MIFVSARGFLKRLLAQINSYAKFIYLGFFGAHKISNNHSVINVCYSVLFYGTMDNQFCVVQLLLLTALCRNCI